jgi:4-hydroxybenzoate polyprenyltransferase
MRPWLQLLRPANVVTALADVLAGYAVVAGGSPAGLGWLLVSTACLYAGGVVLNDYFDRHVDAVERRERPIPSGRVPARAAAILGALMLLAAIGAASRANTTAAIVAAAIAVLVVLYDAAAKRHDVLGPPTMGACRGANLVLGMAAAPAAVGFRWPLALLTFIYITAVTIVSRGEVHGGRRRSAGAALGAVVAVLAAVLALGAAAPAPIWPLAIAALLAWRVVPAFLAAYQRPDARTSRAAVRAGVLSLVLLDASLAAAAGPLPFAILILAIGPVAYGLSRAFAVT